MREFLGGLVFLAILAIVLGAVERRFHAMPPTRVLARKRLVDLAHWLLGGLLNRAAAAVALVVAIAAVLPFLVLARIGDKHPFEGYVAPFHHLPLAVQLVVSVVAIDFTSYWIHRLMHQRPFWTLHAIHHSPRELDWFSSARNHPLAEGLARYLGVLPLLFLGIDGEVLGGVLPFVGIWAIFVHSNVRFELRWLRYVITTPHFHRWHHSRALDARDKNFAGLFPVWDVLFGTLYLPEALPTDFGVDESEQIPEGFVAQMLHPFRSR